MIIAGYDGLVTYVDHEFTNAGKTLHLFHNQRGGIKKFAQAGNGQVLAVDDCGSAQLFKPNKMDLIEEDEELDDDVFLDMLRGQEEIEVGSQTEGQKSWACWMAEEQLAHQRETYKDEIEDIETSLAVIREQVGQLLSSNDQLPPEESLDRREFELNSDEKLRRTQFGCEQEIDLQLELRAWQMARNRSGLRLRRQVWEDLEIKGKAIQVCP